MNNGYNFTERVRKVLAMARDEAHTLHHEYVGTEHLLLALIKDDAGVGAAVLHGLGVDMADIRKRVLDIVKEGRVAQATGPDLPYTSRAKKVLELSMAAARDLNHGYVGTEHLLLGLLREERGVAAQTLIKAGVTEARAHAETVRLLGSNPDTQPRPEVSALHDAAQDRSRRTPYQVSAVFVEMHFDNGTTLRKEFANAAWAIKYLENM